MTSAAAAEKGASIDVENRQTLNDPNKPPDGGLKAWTQALMGHLVVLNTWGYVNSFGVFQVGF